MLGYCRRPRKIEIADPMIVPDPTTHDVIRDAVLEFVPPSRTARKYGVRFEDKSVQLPVYAEIF